MYCSTNTRVGTYARHIWIIMDLCVHVCVGSCVGELCVWGAVWWGAVCGELCVGELCVEELCVGELCGGELCVGELCVEELCVQSPGGPHIHTTLPQVLPVKGGFLTLPSHTSSTACSSFSSPALVPAHSSSQVVYCRVCSPHPLHAPVLVLRLAVYPASPTQGRVGLTDRLTHSAQTQCNPTR